MMVLDGQFPKYGIMNMETCEWIIGPGTGVDEVHNTLPEARQTMDDLGESDALKIMEITPVDAPDTQID